MTDVEVVVVAYRSRHQVEPLLDLLPGETAVCIVDNGRGVDRLDEVAAARPGTRYLLGAAQGFAHAANLGCRTSTAEVVVFVNPDARPSPSMLEELVADVAGGPFVTSAAVPVGDDGRSQLGSAGWEPTVGRALSHAAGLHKVARHSGLFIRPEPGENLAVDWTCGACMAVDRQQFLALGGWDEGFFVYSEDVALGRTVREHGLAQRLRTDLRVQHAGGGSGAPSLEMMRLKGASMARYVHRHNSPAAARAITAALAAGYGARVAQQRLRGDRRRAAEHAAYVRGVWTGRAWVAGREVGVPGGVPGADAVVDPA